MEIGEVTAYAVAWRTGGVWSFEPNPIPMSSVTRAAALWRGGELVAAPLAGLAAGWQVACEAPRGVLAPAAQGATG